ncbi:MAG TPA: hydantoinase, partial [Methanothrix sp.]|nr:hydantoinase [Methanothrix sp.]
MILGLDVGGANTKAASSDGSFTKIEYMPLWKEAPLEPFLCRLSAAARPEAVGVVMTGELADSFPEKRSGILFIKGAVE